VFHIFYLFTCLPVQLSTSPPVYLSVFRACLPVHMCISPPVYLSVFHTYLPVPLFTCLCSILAYVLPVSLLCVDVVMCSWGCSIYVSTSDLSMEHTRCINL